MNGMALCAGVGGLDLGLRLALGESYRTVVYVEREAYAAAVLVARMEDKALDPAPVWDDLLTFAGEPWRGVVDIVTAGFPCQPWSSAGGKRGDADERWLWPDIARVVREARPSYIFLENVTPLALRGGLGHVLGSLADLGFDAEWDVFRASDVGASQRRPRLFVLACAQGHHGRLAAISPRRRGYGAMADARGPGGVLAGALLPPGPETPSERWLGPRPALRRGSDGLADRLGRVRAAGNGVHPLAAAHAFRTLAARMVT